MASHSINVFLEDVPMRKASTPDKVVAAMAVAAGLVTLVAFLPVGSTSSFYVAPHTDVATKAQVWTSSATRTIRSTHAASARIAPMMRSQTTSAERAEIVSTSGLMTGCMAGVAFVFSALGLFTFLRRYQPDESTTWALAASSSVVRPGQKWIRSPKDPNFTSISPDQVELVKKVEELLSKRDGCKKVKDYEAADTIEMELRSMGVFLNSQLRQWQQRAPSPASPRKDPAAPRTRSPSAGKPTAPLTQGPQEGNDDSVPKPKRVAPQAGASAAAKTQATWRRDPQDAALDKDGPVDPNFEAKVLELCAKRDELRQQRKWEDADAVRAELVAMGVTIKTSARTWSMNMTSSSWTPGRPVSEELKAKVDAILIKRDLCWLKKEMEEVARLGQELKAMGILVKGKRRMWIEASTPWEEAPLDGLKMSDELQKEVIELLRQREVFLEKLQYPDADLIQEQIRAKGIFNDDYTRRFRLLPAKQPSSPAE